MCLTAALGRVYGRDASCHDTRVWRGAGGGVVMVKRRGVLRRLAVFLLVVAGVPSAVGLESEARAVTVEQQLSALPLVHQFSGTAPSVSAFSANWTKFSWASGK